jgi:hypothetical protein
MIQSVESEILTDVQAAKFLSVSVQTVRKWRFYRKGPAYVRMGRSIRYQKKDLLAYLGDNRIDPTITSN